MYDVIVVGSGIAGSYIASKLDANVLVLEKDRKPILKDSGIVSSDFKHFFPAQLVQNKIKEMQLVSPSGNQFSLRAEEPFTYILKRKLLSVYLRKQAKKNAKVRYEKVSKIDHLPNAVEVHTNHAVHECRLVVGADGAQSVVRKTVGIKDPMQYTGIFARTKKPLETDKIKIYLNKYFSPDFFSWLIPQNNEYGLITAIRPYEYFKYFKSQMNLPDGDLYASPIPIGYTKSYSNRVILVGDACGQTKPITGGGIIFALTASNHAIATINEAIKNKDFSKGTLSQYEKKWKKDLRWEIRKQRLLRKIYRNLSNSDIDNLFKEFGPHMSVMREFNYDRFSSSWKTLPKLKLMKFLIANLPALLSRKKP